MKKLLLSLGTFLAFASASFSQTTLFQDNFESGGGNWTLNTGSGSNNWVVNNAFLGFSGLIPDTPNQPGSFTNGPQSTYMHITNQTVCGGLSVCNANFDTGSASNQNTELTTAINASTYTNVTVSFWYLCAGQTNVSFGTLEYSVDGGVTWIGTGTNYVNTSSWTQETVSLPAWNNVSAFKIRFKWQNGGGGLDPAFSIDEVLIEGTSGGVSNSIATTTNIVPGSWCEGNPTTIPVDFTSIGTFNAGNSYSAQLSDATGSFAAPTVIGTLSSTANTGQIVSIVPGATPAGSGYRIRVVSDNPVTVGSDNGTDLVINATPSVLQQPFADVCYGGGNITLVGGSPATGTYSGIGVTGGATFDPTALGVGTTNITYTYTDGLGCSGSVTEPITVLASPQVSLNAFANVCTIDPFFTLTGGVPANGTYTGTGVVGGVFDPATAGVGTHTITYTFTDGNGCSGTATETITVEICGAVSEENFASFNVSPNPVKNTFAIQSEMPLESVALITVNGRLVKSFDPQATSYQVENLPAGLYLLRVTINGATQTKRIVIQ